MYTNSTLSRFEERQRRKNAKAILEAEKEAEEQREKRQHLVVA
jgi:hypothetical protein